MNLCHLYYKSTSSNHIQEIVTSFKQSFAFDIDTINQLKDYSIYIIEIEEASQTISAKLNQLFKNKSYPLIYFIVPQKHNLMFFQLTYLLHTEHLITRNMDTKKIISKMLEDIKINTNKKLENLVGKASMRTESFMFFENSSLAQVSDKLLKDFNCSTIGAFKKDILDKLNTKVLLEKDTLIEESIDINPSLTKRYIATSTTASNNEKIVFLKLNSEQSDSLHFISSRVTFIELLKEKIIQKTIKEYDLSAITINIVNIKKLQEELKVIDLEDLLIDFLNFIESSLEKKIIFAQIEMKYYILLFEGIEYDEIQSIATKFNTKVLEYISSQKYKLLIDTYAYNLNNFDFSDIVTTFNNIQNRDLTHDEITSDDLKNISEKKGLISEKSLLDDAFKHSSELKLLNLYHGLVINTPSKILKVTKEEIYVQFDPLQGVVLDIEKRVVLQSPSFLQDIEAKVVKISLPKKIAILEKFKFLKTNANSRKYSRVTTSTKTPIAITISSLSVSGYILDLSIKSIAMEVKYNPKFDSIKTENVTLVFNISNPKAEDGFNRLKLSTKLTFISMEDPQGNCKIVCDIDEESISASIIMEYIYRRQKELIIELKKKSQLH